MRVEENVRLGPLTTFGVGGEARYFVEAADEADVLDAVRWADERGVKLFALGGGSNLLIPDEGFAGLVLRLGIRGVEQDGCRFDVGAGEPWDRLVERTVAEGCAGMECMAGIPGSVGGTPVQNVGAYGQEVSETIESVRALDRRNGEFVELNRAACRFRYRESVFNTTARGRYIVTRVRFGLRAGGAPAIHYADLKKRFEGFAGEPSLGQVAQAVREIRRTKGMLIVEGDPDARSAGSFFKNPVVAEKRLAGIGAAVGAEPERVPHWPAGDGRVKLPAAWLVERAGFGKGYGAGAVGISSRHTLALVNRGGATFADVERMRAEIAKGVERKFGVALDREPVVMD